MRRLIVSALVCVLLGMAHPALAASHGTMSTCSMFTTADAGKALGGKATRTMSKKLGLFTSCDYATPRPYRLIIMEAATTATIQKQRQGATAASVFAESRKGTPGNTQTLKSLGDKAFYVPGLNQLWVLKSDVVFNLVGTAGGGQMGKAQLVRAATLVLKRLGGHSGTVKKRRM